MLHQLRDLLQCRGTEGSAWNLLMWDCLPGEDAWSSAYTVHSILLQLQAFVLDPDLLFATHKVCAKPFTMMGAGAMRLCKCLSLCFSMRHWRRWSRIGSSELCHLGLMLIY